MTYAYTHSIRSTADRPKEYIELLVSEFTKHYISQHQNTFSGKFVGVDICKQDIRSIPSISLRDDKNCIYRQRHFSSYSEIIAFMEGFLYATTEDYV